MVEADTSHERKQPRRATDLEVLIPQLKRAISDAENGRWNKPDWSLLKPENIQALIEEIERSRPASAA